MVQLADPNIYLRCVACWGRARRFPSDSDSTESIACDLCKKSIKGVAARQEFDKILREGERNDVRIAQGKPATYRADAHFVAKVIPDFHRDTTAYEDAERQSCRNENSERRQLSRHSTPVGHAGYLYLQARLLAAAVYSLADEPIMRSQDATILKRLDAQLSAGSDRTTLHWDIELLDPTPPGVVEQRAGLLQMRGFTATFSCEVAMKAILLTRNHRAAMIHDLRKLYDSLPSASQQRLIADFPAIAQVLEDSHQAYSKGKYWENESAVRESRRVSLSLDRITDLEKAGRVLLDECEMVGLEGSLTASWSATAAYKEDGTPYLKGSILHLSLKSGESAIKFPNARPEAGQM